MDIISADDLFKVMSLGDQLRTGREENVGSVNGQYHELEEQLQPSCPPSQTCRSARFPMSVSQGTSPWHRQLLACPLVLFFLDLLQTPLPVSLSSYRQLFWLLSSLLQFKGHIGPFDWSAVFSKPVTGGIHLT